MKKDQGGLVYRQKGLKDGTSYYFSHRAWNVVGCSTWSDVSKFSTKTSKPCRLTQFWMKSATTREVTIQWKPPMSAGVPIMRCDIVGGPNERVLRWCQMVSMMLDATVDSDKLIGYKVKDEAQPGEALGHEEFGELYCEDCMYAPVMMPNQEFTLQNCLPGQDYYFIARGVANTGKGEFSEVLGPCRTMPEAPKTADPMEVYHVEDTSCSVFFRLPFNFGSPITEIHAVLNRVAGPISLDEHDEGGLVQAHIAGQHRKDRPADIMAFCTLGDLPPGQRQQGMTAAVKRNYEAEGLQQDDAWNAGIKATFERCTGVMYKVDFQNLRPGSDYEVSWSCKNAVGHGPVSCPIGLTTLPAVPDKPYDIAVTGL